MLDISNELLDDLNRTDLLPIDNESFEVLNLIKDYELENDPTILNTIESQYLIVTNFIIGLYLENQVLPDDLKSFLRNSHNYRLYLLDNIKNRMKNIINESSTLLFKEIYIILNLLSNGNSYSFLNDNNMYATDQLKFLLNDYEDNVCEQFIKKDIKRFNLSFNYYLTLLEVLNEICVINSIDIERRKNINAILELITNTITNIKSKIQLYENDIRSLNAILGKLLLYFTNMSYITIDKNNKDVVIQKYAFMLNKLIDGYQLLNHDEKYYLTFLDKTTTLILTLMFKLKTKLHINNISFEDSKDLDQIYNTYNKNVNTLQQIEAENLDIFKEKLLSNYQYIYSNTIDENLNEYTDPIDYFINKEIITNIDMVIIHNIILYSDTTSKDKLDLILKGLIEKNKFDNDYYEFYKLKIIDRILQKYISLKIKTSENIYINDIIKYIEHNNLISHLMSMYSKIYLSLSLYYSYEKNESSQEESKKYYFIYKRLDNNNFLEKEFNNLSKQILFNYAKSYFRLLEFKSLISFTNTEYLQIGKDLINKYIYKKELEVKNSSLEYVEELIKEILDINEPNDLWLNEKIEDLISNKIFFGLVKAKVEHISDESKYIEIGYDRYTIPIEEDYALVLYFSSYYKMIINTTLEKNLEFIELNSKNIFKSYLNSIPSYTDVITNLPNINKLKNELRKYEGKKITFFEVYLDSVVTVSESFNIEVSNEFYNKAAQKINEEVDAYRLFGPKIGIILDENKHYKEVVDYLQNIKVMFQNEEVLLKPIIAVSIGEADKILDKSFYALSSAKISNDKLYIFE